MDADDRPEATAVTEGAPVDDHPVLLFDGVCNLCNRTVQFVVPRDPTGIVRFAPLQSEVGTELLERVGLPTDEMESVVLVEGDEVYRKSAAAIRVAELLGWPYSLASVGRLVPDGLRDAAYDVVAENRYDWFGRKDQCMVPDDDVSDRFLG
ncbi:thiol-disulfide oxidoreductase DCC family protein [Halomicroarcula sp. F13]|uniref:Thiol-disulfide oxidoreductase DCC family protein n=1 Tax=Haloarcula rubra TaxID=2487747 RepID=A0AAW4PTW6_9EURY|nr:thiol-disulfide oxidoreductase DCC family protein [Halomicroarcula rubra]MBX0324636.1 thiol-disulfide oxidoreductase DCC family protein [Halomicroarcula rubra]